MRKNLKTAGWFLLIFSSLACGLIGLFSFVGTINKTKKLSPASITVLKESQPETEVLIEGHISEKNPIQSRTTGFVAFNLEMREIYYDKNGDAEPTSWHIEEEMTPPLLIDLPDGQVQIENNDYRIEDGHIIDETSPNQSLNEINTRYIGLAAGDSVLVVGLLSKPIDDKPQIKADFIATGTQESFLAQKQRTGFLISIFSLIVILLAAFIFNFLGCRDWIMDRINKRID